VSDYELGYTPDNLKRILSEHGKTREDLAELLGISVKNVHNWCVAVDHPKHKSLNHKRWLKMLEWLNGG